MGLTGSRRLRAALTALATALALTVPVVPVGAVETPTSDDRGSTESRPEYVAGQLLVRFQPDVSERGRSDVRRRHDLDKIRDLPVPGLELVSFGGRGSPPERAGQVHREDAVRYAEPNFLFYPQASPGDDTEYPELWGMHNTGQATGYTPTTGTPDADIDAPEGWQVTTGSDEILVGVIDTGVEIAHEDLAETIALNGDELPPATTPTGDAVLTVADYADTPDGNGNGRLDPDDVLAHYSDGHDGRGAGDTSDDNGLVDDIAGWDFHNDDNTVFDPHQPDDHGTHVSGTIAGVDNTLGVIGVSNARIVPMKFLGPAGGDTADAVDAVYYGIEQGVHLTSNSWGGGGATQALQDAITAAGEANQLFVAAAGNAGSDNDRQPSYPASYPNENVVAVAATDSNDALASFSNYGAESVDLGAPGVGTYSTVPQFAKAVLYDGTYYSGLHSIGLEGIKSQTDREALVSAMLDWAGVGPTDPILLVDDDLGADHQDVWLSTLTATAVGHAADSITTHTVPTSGAPHNKNGPSASTMNDHALTIWFTGEDYSTTLKGADRSSISSYLQDSSDKVALFGIDIGYDLDNNQTGPSTFLRDVLKTDYVADYDVNYEPRGVTGVPHYETVPVLELQPGDTPPGQLYSDALSPRPAAVAGLRGSPYTWFSGTSMATPHVSGAAAQVYASYPEIGYADAKSRLMDGGDTVASLVGKTVSGKRLNLVGALDTAGSPSLTAVSASPTTITPDGDGVDDEATISWTQNEPATVTVSVEPAAGSTAVRTEELGPKRSGSHSWVWDGTDGTDVVASGDYTVHIAARDVLGNESIASAMITVKMTDAKCVEGGVCGDFNGDGYVDLAVGVPGEDAGSTDGAGAVVVMYGSSSGLSTAGAQQWLYAPEPGDQFGAALV